MKTAFPAAAAAALALAGCASIIEGTTQTINVTTAPEGARCEFHREGKIIGVMESAPGALVVEKLKHDITLKCRKSGYKESSQTLKSGTEGAVLGNIIMGGVVGWAVDSASGADNKYPENVHVNLTPE